MGKRGLFLIFFLVICLVCTPAAQAAQYSPHFDVNSEAVYMVNLDSDMLIYAKNERKKLYPASLTKLMTTILAMEKVSDLDNTMVTMKVSIENEIYLINKQLGGISLAGLRRNETMSMRKLIYAMMLPSGNEAALIVADYVGGDSVANFVKMMNAKAAELGCQGTHFSNPNGLYDAENYTTAYDMYLIAKHAMSLPGFMDIVSTTSYDGGPTNVQEHLYWTTTNKMMVASSPAYYPYVKGIKTGTLDQAGRCFISTAQKNGYSYMMVLMNAPIYDTTKKAYADNMAFVDARQLYSWAFDSFTVKTLLEKGKNFDEVPLKLAWGKDHIKLMSAQNFAALVPNEIEVSSVSFERVLPEYACAPINKGDQVGEVKLILSGEVIGTVPLVAAETVEMSRLLLMLDKLTSAFGGFWFKFLAIFLVLLMMLYTALTIARNKNRRKFRTVKHKKNL